MIKLGFIGYGFVGKAMHTAFEHNCLAYIVDPAKNPTPTIHEMVWSFKPTVIFVSLPAPTLEDGSVDISIIRNVLQELVDQTYEGIVVLKSTVPPEKINDLYEEFANDTVFQKKGPLRFVYSPEFLREQFAKDDVLNAKSIILAGNWQDCMKLKEIYTNHSHIKTRPTFRLVDYRVASMIKYAVNSFLAMKVTFMNQMYQLYGDVYDHSVSIEDWEEFVAALTDDPRIGVSHNMVPGPDGQYGYGGTCFPKDVKAIIGEDKKERLTVLREVEQANTKIRLTGKLQSSDD